MTGLPVATTTRWQPLRAGLVDLFYYDYQEFWFRDGRLMLRGNNGTGKSKVLALTLPLLLDADLSPARVEPDGDRDKRMEWNLLLGGRYEERLGYAWLEFGRRTEDGDHASFTIGCGLKAVAGRGIADHWYFVTSQRVGADLFLVGPNSTVLTRDRLVAAVGEYGQVFQKAKQYRRAVDEHLFHLGPDRYGALVDLLVQLRQPQLSKRPNEQRLSDALSDALAPIDQSVIADIAAAFHDLEQQRDELTGLRETRDHVTRFLRRYQHYARVAARRQGRELRAAHAAYEHVGRQLAAVREQLAQAAEGERLAAARLAEISSEIVERTAARDELAGRPELASIEHAERLAEATAAAARSAADRAELAGRQLGERRGRHAAVVTALQRIRETLVGAAGAAAAAASAAGVDADHAELSAPLGLPVAVADGPPAAEHEAAPADEALELAERHADGVVARRDDAVAHTLELSERAGATATAAAAARARLHELDAELDTLADLRSQADQAVVDAGQALLGAWRRYAAAVTELDLPDPDEVGLEAWTGTLDGANPAVAALRLAAAAGHQRLATATAEATTQVGALDETLATLTEQRDRLEAGEQLHPPAPHTRGDGVRDGRPGAPLWRVTEFARGLDERARAGVEAALEASGLLDAWVTPEGTLLDPGTHDVMVHPGSPAPGNLAEVMVPAVDADDPQAGALTDRAVARVLAAIAVGGDGGAPARIDGTGAWRVGPLEGAWSKPAAEYVGAGAREQARRRRLAALAGEITATQRARAAAWSALEDVKGRQRTLVAEIDAQPGDQALRDAHGAAAAAARELARAERRVAEQARAVEAAEQAAKGAARTLEEAAADLRLPSDAQGLRAVRTAVEGYRRRVADLFLTLRRHGDALSDLDTWTQELHGAEAADTAARRDAGETNDAARDAASRLATLQAAVGATADELRECLADAKRELARLQREHKQLSGRHHDLTLERGQAEGRARQLEEDQAAESGRRDQAVGAFQRFAATGLLAVAAVDLELPVTGAATAAPWAPDPAVRLARRLEQALAEVDDGDQVWQRVQDEIGRRYTELGEALSRQQHHAVMGVEDERIVVTIQFQGRERSPSELTALLDEEIAYRERLLTARQREVIEEHLVNDVASHLQELIADADAQVLDMNAELAERPTSTGMRVRLGWQPRPDGPDGLEAARRRLLRQDAELWSPDDRAAVGAFLERLVEAEQASHPGGTWQEHLERALDYRRWHRFAIERFQDGRWRPATGPASGGERVLTVSLPLFAAASAHYRSAHPHAPRLVLLDEAFAGVDDDARAKCLGLLAAFDLDVVLTSEREWGFYATVPGIATHQLVRRDGIDAVHVTAWEWDGATAAQVERSFAMRPPEENGHAADGRGRDDAALW